MPKAQLLPGMFENPNADGVIDALGKVLAVQIERVNEALDKEDAGKPKAETTRMLNAVFANGVRFAKLVAPARFSPGNKVQIMAPGAQIAIPPQRVVAEIVEEFVKLGVAPGEITGDMIEMMMQKMGWNTGIQKVPALGPGDDDD